MNTAGTALLSAASWGAADFCGGMAARRMTPYQAVAVAHLFSLLIILALIHLLHLPMASHQTLVAGLAAGVFGGAGLMLFYEALSYGAMGLTAAIAGVLTAAVPVIFGLLTEGLPKAHQLLGFLAAIVSIWLIAAAPSTTRPTRRTLWLGVISGLCFGTYFITLKFAAAGGTSVGVVFWAMAYSRVTSATLAGALCLWVWLRPQIGVAATRWGWQALALAAAVGILDTGGNMLYMAAAHLGRLDIAAVLSSLYPAATILLAAAFLKERTSKGQTAGMVLALGAVALIAS